MQASSNSIYNSTVHTTSSSHPSENNYADNYSNLMASAEHYDLENASSIAPSDIDIVYHYKGFRNRHDAHLHHLTAGHHHSKNNGSSSSAINHAPLSRLSPSVSELSAVPRILTLQDLSPQVPPPCPPVMNTGGGGGGGGGGGRGGVVIGHRKPSSMAVASAGVNSSSNSNSNNSGTGVGDDDAAMTENSFNCSEYDADNYDICTGGTVAATKKDKNVFQRVW